MNLLTLIAQPKPAGMFEFQQYNGLRPWTDSFSDRCAFMSQNATTVN